MSITKSFQQLTKLFDPHHTMLPLYEMPQSKPNCIPRPSLQPLPCAIPEEVGVPSRLLAAFIQTLAQDSTSYMHNLMIIRHGRVILDFSFRGYDTNIWKYTYSACKSLVSLAIGALIDRGQLKLSDKIEAFLPPSELNAIVRLKFKDITVQTLLTMSTGSSFNEVGVAIEENWLRGFLSSTLKLGNESLFEYNSMNTYMLSYIVKQASGKNLSEVLREAFFEPMGIRDYHWELSPDGIEKGGWGLFIRPEDFAKFGLLILQDGVWNGKQLISKEYLKQATSMQRVAPHYFGAFHYGYQMWVGRDRDTVLFNGMHGQNVLIDRVNDMIFVTNAGNNEMFQQSAYFSHVERFFFKDRFADVLPPDEEGNAVLKNTMKRIQPSEPEKREKKPRLLSRVLKRLPPALPSYFVPARLVSGQTWYPCSDHANCMGLFPRMFQITQGRFSSGLASVSFSFDEKHLILNWSEKEQTYCLSLGFGKPVLNQLSFGSVSYLAGADFRFAKDEYDQLVLLIRIDFVETPYSRLMKFRFLSDGSMRLSLSELPGSEFLLGLTEFLIQDLKTKPIIGPTLNRMDGDYLDFLVRRVLEPRLQMSLTSTKETDASDSKRESVP